MAITSVTVTRQPRLSKIKASGSMSFLVKFDAFTSYSQMYESALTAVDPSSGMKIPQQGMNLDGDTPSENDPLCTNAVASLHEEQNLWWKVDCTFGGSDNPSSQSGDQQSDIPPWQKAKTYKWGHTNVQRKLTIDAEGNPILNSAGQPFDESIFVPVAVRTLTCTWVVKKGSWNPITGASFINTVNDQIFKPSGYSVAAESAFCSANDGTLTTITYNGSEVPVWQRSASWQIITDDDGDWNGMVLDQGHEMAWVSSEETVEYAPIKSKSGTKFTSPQLLNGGGERLIFANGELNLPQQNPSRGLPVDAANSTDDRIWLEYVPYGKTNHKAIL